MVPHLVGPGRVRQSSGFWKNAKKKIWGGSAGWFLEENPLGKRGSPLGPGQLMRKSHGFFIFFIEKYQKLTQSAKSHDFCWKLEKIQATSSHELACFGRRSLEILACSAFWVSPEKPPPPSPESEALNPPKKPKTSKTQKPKGKNKAKPQKAKQKQKTKTPKPGPQIKILVTGFWPWPKTPRNGSLRSLGVPWWSSTPTSQTLSSDFPYCWSSGLRDPRPTARPVGALGPKALFRSLLAEVAQQPRYGGKFLAPLGPKTSRRELGGLACVFFAGLCFFLSFCICLFFLLCFLFFLLLCFLGFLGVPGLTLGRGGFVFLFWTNRCASRAPLCRAFVANALCQCPSSLDVLVIVFKKNIEKITKSTKSDGFCWKTQKKSLPIPVMDPRP